MLESDGDVLELMCQKYRGVRPILKRWHGGGFDLLLLKFGDAVVSGSCPTGFLLALGNVNSCSKTTVNRWVALSGFQRVATYQCAVL